MDDRQPNPRPALPAPQSEPGDNGPSTHRQNIHSHRLRGGHPRSPTAPPYDTANRTLPPQTPNLTGPAPAWMTAFTKHDGFVEVDGFTDSIRDSDCRKRSAWIRYTI